MKHGWAVLSFIFSMLALLVGFWVWWHQPTWVCVDMQALVRDAVSQLPLQTMGEAELKQSVNQTIDRCRKAVRVYGSSKGLRVLPKSVALSPLPDVTEKLMGKKCDLGKD